MTPRLIAVAQSANVCFVSTREAAMGRRPPVASTASGQVLTSTDGDCRRLHTECCRSVKASDGRRAACSCRSYPGNADVRGFVVSGRRHSFAPVVDTRQMSRLLIEALVGLFRGASRGGFRVGQGNQLLPNWDQLGQHYPWDGQPANASECNGPIGVGDRLS